MQQQVTKVCRVQRLQPLLILCVQGDRAAIRKLTAIRHRNLVGRQTSVFPTLNDTGQHSCGPPLLIDMLRLEQLLQQANLIIHIEDREVRFQSN